MWLGEKSVRAANAASASLRTLIFDIINLCIFGIAYVQARTEKGRRPCMTIPYLQGNTMFCEANET